jgi:hypothetical protein
MEGMTKTGNRLSDPAQAAQAWARYRWIMRWVVAAAVLSVAAALFFLVVSGIALTTTIVVATTAGVALSVLLAGGLMGLVFMSSGTGHDDDVAHPDRRDGPDF